MAKGLAIELKVEGLEKFERRLKSTTLQRRQGVRRVVAGTAMGIQSDAKEDAPVDTGILRASIMAVPYNEGLSAEVFVNAEYGRDVEEGTGPHFPPIEALEQWGKRKGLDLGAVYAIARHIAKSGTNAQPYFGPAVEKWARGYSIRVKAALQSGE